MDSNAISTCLGMARNSELRDPFSHIVEKGIVSQSHQLL
jgi:hypothetical protein